MSAFQNRRSLWDDPFDPLAQAAPAPAGEAPGQGLPLYDLSPKADQAAPVVAHMCEPGSSQGHTLAPDPAVAAPAPAIKPDLTAAGGLDDQVAQARTTLAQIENGIRAEDYGTRRGEERNTKGKMDEERTRSVLAPQLCPLQKAALHTDADKRAFVAGVQQLLKDYLATPLQGSDDAEGGISVEDWAAAGEHGDGGGFVLTRSSPTSEKLGEWQKAGGFVKYVVTLDGAMRVGPPDLPHQVIAGRHQDKMRKGWVPNSVLTAGVVRFTFSGDKRSIGALENTSGGFRPGALRNDTALKAAQGAESLPADPSAVDVHQNLTGGYGTSSLAQTGHGAAGAPIAHLPRR